MLKINYMTLYFFPNTCKSLENIDQQLSFSAFPEVPKVKKYTPPKTVLFGGVKNNYMTQLLFFYMTLPRFSNCVLRHYRCPCVARILQLQKVPWIRSRKWPQDAPGVPQRPQEPPEAATRRQEQPGGARRPQETPGGARMPPAGPSRPKEQPGAARSNQEQSRARRRQGAPGRPRRT